MTERAFGFLRINERESKPRSRGLTEIRGPYYTPVGRRYLEDLFVVALTRRVVATGLDAKAERATSAQTTRPRSRTPSMLRRVGFANSVVPDLQENWTRPGVASLAKWRAAVQWLRPVSPSWQPS